MTFNVSSYIEAFLTQDSWLFNLFQNADTCNNFASHFKCDVNNSCDTYLFFNEVNASSLNIFQNINSCINLVVHA